MHRARITTERSQAAQESHGRPVYLVDDSGQDALLAIVRVDLLKRLVDDQFDIAETYAAQEAALAEVWNDSQLDEYTCEDGSPID
jgi:hypothetical protein